MSRLNPIYTEMTECTDCNKCIRECPVKGIKVESGHAIIDPELCILCGHCSRVCPRGAKKVRNDLAHVRKLVKSGRKVAVSVAPSYISEFPGMEIEVLNGLFKSLGFYKVQETALGAQAVTRYIDQNHKNSDKVAISSACPVIVSYLKKYRPDFRENIMNIHSPLLAHCSKLKSEYECDVVFFGPCVAKKMEADSSPELLTAALTFKDLRQWIDEEDIDLENIVPESLDKRATNGSFYPIDGGMIESLPLDSPLKKRSYSFSGIESIVNALEGIDKEEFKGSFFELLACDGGCINGPGASCHSKTALKRLNVLKRASHKDEINPIDIAIDNPWNIEAISDNAFSDADIKNVMRSIGKLTENDEINCGACGYSTCREFAIAMLEDKAETNMCLNYLRNLSEQKANTLINTMPSGVIMVDSSLTIIESNSAFAKLMGEDCSTIYSVNDGLNGVSLKKILPQFKIFEECLKSGKSQKTVIKVRGRIIKCIVYSVVDYLVVGGIFRDITEPRAQREEIISKAQEVLSKNVETVQQIAYLLGESAAESEIMLNSIISSYGEVDDDEFCS